MGQKVWAVMVWKAWRAEVVAEMHDYLFIFNTVATWA